MYPICTTREGIATGIVWTQVLKGHENTHASHVFYAHAAALETAYAKIRVLLKVG